jgi:hypothetical protein
MFTRPGFGVFPIKKLRLKPGSDITIKDRQKYLGADMALNSIYVFFNAQGPNRSRRPALTINVTGAERDI